MAMNESLNGEKMNCPKCSSEMKAGYSSANSSLSWIDKEKFESYIFKDEDLAQSGFKNLFPWKGGYYGFSILQVPLHRAIQQVR